MTDDIVWSSSLQRLESAISSHSRLYNVNLDVVRVLALFALHSTIFGFVLVMMLSTLSSWSRQKYRPQPRTITSMLSLAALMLATTTIGWILTGTFVIVYLRTFVPTFQLSRPATTLLALASTWQTYFPFIASGLGYATVIWKAWHVWSQNKKSSCILLGLLVVSTIAGTFVKRPRSKYTDSGVVDHLLRTLSFGTNAVATWLVPYIERELRPLFKLVDARRLMTTKADKIGAYLINSGAHHCVVWIALTLSWIHQFKPRPDVPPVQLTLRYEIMFSMFSISLQIAAIYPAFILVIVYFQRAVWNVSVEEESRGSDLTAVVDVDSSNQV